MKGETSINPWRKDSSAGRIVLGEAFIRMQTEDGREARAAELDAQAAFLADRGELDEAAALALQAEQLRAQNAAARAARAETADAA